MGVPGDDGEAVGPGRGEVRGGVLGAPGQGRAVGQGAPDGVLPTRGVHLVPGVQVHVDPANHHGGAVRGPRGEPLGPAPHHVLHGAVLGAGVHGPVHLPEEVAGGLGGPHGPGGVAEALLGPGQGAEAAHVLEQHPLRVGQGDPVLAADLQQQIRGTPLLLQPVDLREGGQGPRALVTDPAARARSVTAVHLPGAGRLRAWTEETAGLTLGIGLGAPEPSDALRIAHMGHASAHMLLGVLGVMQAGMTALSIPHGPGALDAAAATIARLARTNG